MGSIYDKRLILKPFVRNRQIINTQTDIATTRLNQPGGRFSENLPKVLGGQRALVVDYTIEFDNVFWQEIDKNLVFCNYDAAKRYCMSLGDH